MEQTVAILLRVGKTMALEQNRVSQVLMLDISAIILVCVSTNQMEVLFDQLRISGSVLRLLEILWSHQSCERVS